MLSVQTCDFTDAILINPQDTANLGFKDGGKVILKNQLGELSGRIYTAPIPAGNLQVHWTEGNVLLDKSKRSLKGIPNIVL
ncbi:hypothetical protein [Nostoc sp. PCC 7524]|uniref:hypothetical protein n=1 Tax=Nostoc sp. (strain ATCC 29411 / PCC 7524) TaxID=28072 RepID=UPI0005A1D587|nr:hypothetical protein [Nostoc sp. PCC 7524]